MWYALWLLVNALFLAGYVLAGAKSGMPYSDRNDIRTPVIGPICPGGPPLACEDPPEEADVLLAWKKPKLNLPGFCEEFHDNIQIVPQLIIDKIDSPVMITGLGNSRLHRCHWKVSIYYDETIEWTFPTPFKCKRPRVDVLYMDLDVIHPCAGEKK